MTDSIEQTEEIDYRQRAAELELLLQASRERATLQANEIDTLRVQLTIVTNDLEGLRATLAAQQESATDKS